MTYPYIEKYGIQVVTEPHPHCPRWQFLKQLRKHCITKKFRKEMGVCTQLLEGPYPSDVEAALERVETGRKMRAEEWD